MTDNLPAPARPDFGGVDGPTVALAAAPTVALAFALGYACARPQSANAFGPFVALCDQLRARPNQTSAGQLLTGTQWDALMAVLPPAQARAVVTLYQMQRGQKWARTGVRPPMSG